MSRRACDAEDMTRYISAIDALRQKISMDNSYREQKSPQVKNADCKVDMGLPSDKKTGKGGSAVKLLWVDITEWKPSSQFLLLSGAVFMFYLVYGYMQELIFRLKEFRPFGWYLTLIQFGCYVIFGIVELQLKEKEPRRIPLKMYGLLSFLTVATMGLSNTSVGYLNYPTQVIFKCCKLIPVMIGSVLIQGKRYSLVDVTAMLCMCLGLVLFTLADSSVSPNYNTYGIILISLALCADGAIGNFQEKSLKQYSASNSEMVLYSYGIGFVYILCGLLLSGGFSPAFQFCQKYPVETYGYAVIFSISGYFGVGLVLTLVRTFGALVAVTVTTGRKAVTIVLSFIFFTKPFTSQYVWAGLLVVFGIYLNLYSKNSDSWNKAFHSAVQQIHRILSPHKEYKGILTNV